jgi:hypothetical protein
MSAARHPASRQKGDTTMLTKIVRLTAVAAVLLASATASFAAPNTSKRVAEPVYFQLAQGENT